MVCDAREPSHETPRRLIGESSQALGSGQKNFLEDVVHFHPAAQLFAHFVIHQDGQPAPVFPKQQAERSLLPSFEAFYQVTRRGLQIHRGEGPKTAENACTLTTVNYRSKKLTSQPCPLHGSCGVR